MWFNDYVVQKIFSNLNMDIGAIVGQAVQDLIVHKLRVMKGKKYWNLQKWFSL